MNNHQQFFVVMFCSIKMGVKVYVRTIRPISLRRTRWRSVNFNSMSPYGESGVDQLNLEDAN